jgi:hypothetical protein
LAESPVLISEIFGSFFLHFYIHKALHPISKLTDGFVSHVQFLCESESKQAFDVLKDTQFGMVFFYCKMALNNGLLTTVLITKNMILYYFPAEAAGNTRPEVL